jgi:hypothetical protein
MAMLCSGSHVPCELLTEKNPLGKSKPEVDEEGFVYHEITLAENQHVYDNAQSVMSFALMLPKKDQYGQLRYCAIDKDWRIVDKEKEWTVIN